MPATDIEPSTDSPPPPAIQYARGAVPVTRRQFRFLLLLTLLNTILLATFVCAPTVAPFIRGNWQEYQANRKLRREQQQREAFLQQVGAYTAPADQVVYEENPILAAKLLNSSPDFANIPTNPDSIMHLTPQPWQPPVRRKEPALLSQLRPILGPYGLDVPFDATLLLHALKSPNGQQRLVWVVISGEQQLLYTSRNELRRELQAHTSRRLSAYVIETNTGLEPVQAKRPTRLLPAIGTLKTTVTWTRGATWENGQITINPQGLFRFYAAQLDPADPSHFTIDYTLDEQRNTIDGYLRDDDDIHFIPRTGRIVGDSAQGKIWDLFAAPATRPAQ